MDKLDLLINKSKQIKYIPVEYLPVIVASKQVGAKVAKALKKMRKMLW